MALVIDLGPRAHHSLPQARLRLRQDLDTAPGVLAAAVLPDPRSPTLTHAYIVADHGSVTTVHGHARARIAALGMTASTILHVRSVP